jgi:hypothetical protein
MRLQLLSGFAIFLCASSVRAEDKPEAKLDLFPLAKGMKWEYEVSVAGQTKDVVQEVTKVTAGKKGERAIATLTTNIEAQMFTEDMSTDDKAIYRHAFNGMALETPLAIVKYPFKAGSTWKETIKIGQEEALAKFDTSKSEEVKVAAGKYTAYPVLMEMETMGQKVSSKSWYADGVGMVKQEVNLGAKKITMELKKFTKGKKDD